MPNMICSCQGYSCSCIGQRSAHRIVFDQHDDDDDDDSDDSDDVDVEVDVEVDVDVGNESAKTNATKGLSYSSLLSHIVEPVVLNGQINVWWLVDQLDKSNFFLLNCTLVIKINLVINTFVSLFYLVNRFFIMPLKY